MFLFFSNFLHDVASNVLTISKEATSSRINAMMAKMLLVTGMVAGLVTAETPLPDDFLADKGNWTVTQGNQSCIMVTMAGTVSNVNT